MLNPIITTCRNNLHLTRKAIKTFEAQDIDSGVYILIIDNASTDGTAQFLQTKRNLATIHFNPPLSVAESWNRGLEFVFRAGAEYALVVNNDTELHPATMRHLVNDGGGFVTAVGVRQWPAIINEQNPENKLAHPDFSCFLIGRWVYEIV